MRIAVLSDIHANLAALEAAVEHVDAWKPDTVIVAGDVINRGPRPLECLAIIEERRAFAGWKIIRGNHEDYVLSEAEDRAHRPDWERKLCQHSAWTCSKVKHRLAELVAWPDRLDLPGGVRVMHASAKGNRAGLYPHMGNEVIRGMIDPAASVFCVGHTHVPFARTVEDTLVVNAGAVGMPFDGDVRGCLAHLEKSGETWRVDFARINYDRARTERDFVESGYLEHGGSMVKLIYNEFKTARPRLGEWHRLFEQMVKNSHITIEASVEELLTSP